VAVPGFGESSISSHVFSSLQKKEDVRPPQGPHVLTIGAYSPLNAFHSA